MLLAVQVSASGLPERVEVSTSSGSPRLDQAALETVRRWRFIPAQQAGKPVAAGVIVPVTAPSGADRSDALPPARNGTVAGLMNRGAATESAGFWAAKGPAAGRNTSRVSV